MHSFPTWMVMAGGVSSQVLTATPLITPAPTMTSIERVKRDDIDPVSLAEVLLTAVPQWIRGVVATNVPQASSFISEEFQGGHTPEWFQALPSDIQSYLVAEFGPATATARPTEPFPIPLPTAPASASAPVSETNEHGTSEPIQTGQAAVTASVTTITTQTLHSSQSSQSPLVESEASSLTRSFETISIPVAKHSSTLSNPLTSPTSREAPSDQAGLSKSQKMGIGIGVPLALLGAAALGFGCCFLLRRRRRQRKTADGSDSPSSPGFIPRFAFQEKSTESLEQHHPLNRASMHSWQDLPHMAWDDDVVEPADSQKQTAVNQNHQPIMAPALFHTHSSNRARGKRTSYTSLQSVAEVREPEEAESPVLPRQSPSRPSLTIPPVPVAAQIKRKPVGSGQDSPNTSPPPHAAAAAAAASQTWWPLAMGDHNHNRKGSGEYHQRGRESHHSINSSPCVSPVEERRSNNPFSNQHNYSEDYGPEFHHGYIDIENGLYGGHTSLSRYPEPKRSKTEWPLRNVTRHKRTKSPLWDRIYEE